MGKRGFLDRIFKRKQFPSAVFRSGRRGKYPVGVKAEDSLLAGVCDFQPDDARTGVRRFFRGVAGAVHRICVFRYDRQIRTERDSGIRRNVFPADPDILSVLLFSVPDHAFVSETQKRKTASDGRVDDAGAERHLYCFLYDTYRNLCGGNFCGMLCKSVFPGKSSKDTVKKFDFM